MASVPGDAAPQDTYPKLSHCLLSPSLSCTLRVTRGTTVSSMLLVALPGPAGQDLAVCLRREHACGLACRLAGCHCLWFPSLFTHCAPSQHVTLPVHPEPAASRTELSPGVSSNTTFAVYTCSPSVHSTSPTAWAPAPEAVTWAPLCPRLVHGPRRS